MKIAIIGKIHELGWQVFKKAKLQCFELNDQFGKNLGQICQCAIQIHKD